MDDNLQLIGDFLRRKRESLSPEMMGLPKPARSRTPGLRREDVASLAGISSVWYSKIERGKAEGISPGVLSALGEALQLNPSEQNYLHTLASRKQINIKAPCSRTSEETERLLKLINPLPAMLINDYFDIINTNESFSHLCGLDVNSLPQEERNYIWLTMTNLQWQQYLQIDSEADLVTHVTRQAGFMRNTMASRPNDHRLQTLVSRFVAQPVFAAAWGKNTVQQCPESMLYTFHHARLGEMVFKKQIWINGYGEATGRMNVYHPQNEIDYQRLTGITG